MNIPLNLNSIQKLVSDLRGRMKGDMVHTAHRIGILATNYARETKGFDDQTGNLRNSINYAVAVDGQVENVVNSNENGEHPVARENSDQFAGELQSGPGNVKLVCYAGMEYGIYVEAKGHDVISQAAARLPELIEEDLSGRSR